MCLPSFEAQAYLLGGSEQQLRGVLELPLMADSAQNLARILDLMYRMILGLLSSVRFKTLPKKKNINLPPVSTPPPRFFNFGIPPANKPASCGGCSIADTPPVSLLL